MSPRKLTKILTERQSSALDFITNFTRRHGYPPSLREIGSALDIGSTNGVRCLLISIEKKGYLRRKRHLSRGIEVVNVNETPSITIRKKRTKRDEPFYKVPIVGKVAAGAPLLAVENIEGILTVDRDFFPHKDGFALRVKGKSMIEAGIMDGDIVLARPSLPLQPGSIVVALIGDEATVKHYYPEPDRVRLEPANPHFGSIIVESNTPGFSIVGKVVGLFRRY